MVEQGVLPRRILAVLLGVSAVAHVLVALSRWPSVTSVVSAVVALAAIGTAFVVPVRSRQADLLVAIVVGAVGVLSFLVTAVLALGGGTPPAAVLTLWPIVGFLADTVVARLAAITLRREAKAGAAPG